MTSNCADLQSWANLIAAAWQAREYAYAPYSGFTVGAAVETEHGNIYSGCNVENISYGLTNCAERTAMFHAVAHGERRIARMVVCADTPEPVMPCGACRQVMQELCPNVEILLINKAGQTLQTTMQQLLPNGFQQFSQQKNILKEPKQK